MNKFLKVVLFLSLLVNVLFLAMPNLIWLYLPDNQDIKYRDAIMIEDFNNFSVGGYLDKNTKDGANLFFMIFSFNNIYYYLSGTRKDESAFYKVKWTISNFPNLKNEYGWTYLDLFKYLYDNGLYNESGLVILDLKPLNLRQLTADKIELYTGKYTFEVHKTGEIKFTDSDGKNYKLIDEKKL